MTAQALPDCPQCKGTGWLLDETTKLATVQRCPDCQSQLRVQRLLKSAEIPPRYERRKPGPNGPGFPRLERRRWGGFEPACGMLCLPSP